MNTLLNQDPAGIKQVCLTDCKNTLEEFMAVVRYHAELIFSPEFCENIRANRRLIDRFLAMAPTVCPKATCATPRRCRPARTPC